MDTMELGVLEKHKLRQFGASILADIRTLESNDKPEKDSAFVRIFGAKPNRQLDRFELGNIPMEKGKRYKTLSYEKGERVLERPEHLSSYQSMDEKLDRWPGAIRAGKKVVSVSGLTWKGDEALALQLAIEMGWLDAATAFRIAETSGNRLFEDLYHLRNGRHQRSVGRI